MPATKESISYIITKRGLKKKYIAEQLSIRPETFSRKLKKPETFNAREMGILSEILQVNVDSMDFNVFFYPKT